MKEFNLYVSASEVRRYLGLDEERFDDEYLEQLIFEKCEYIDRISNTTWNKNRRIAKERYDMTRYKGGVWIGVGVPIYVEHYPITKVRSLKVFQGTKWIEFVGKYPEQRGKSWWVDYEEGIIYIQRIWWYQGGKEIYVEYEYGRDDLPAYITELARLLVAREIITMDRYRMAMPEGGTSISLEGMLESINKRIAELEEQIRAIKVAKISI